MSIPAEQIRPRIVGVHAQDVPELWPEVEPIIARAVALDTGYELNHVATQLIAGRWQLFVIGDPIEAVIVTSLHIYPCEKVLWIQYVAGENLADWLDEWLEAQDAYARFNGCTAIETRTEREGFGKIVKRCPGWEPGPQLYRKRIEP